MPQSRRKPNTPTKSKRALKGLEVLRLHLQGKRQSEIAAALKISQPTASRYLEAALREMRVGVEADLEVVRKKEIAITNMREAEAYAAWERSLERGPDGQPTK